jgi:chaperonin GroES
VLGFDVRVGGAQDDVERVRKLRDDRGERLDDVLDALVGREESEREDHRTALDPEPVLAATRCGQERNAMRDEVDLFGADAVHVAREPRSGRAHDHHPLRERRQLVHHAALESVRLGEDGVQRGDDGHPQFAQQLQDVTPGFSAEDPVLVLDADDVDGVDVQEVRGATVRGDLALGDLEANTRRVGIAPAGIVHREDEALDLGTGRSDGPAQIGRESRDPAMTRQVVAEHRDLPDRSPAADGFDEFLRASARSTFEGARPIVTPDDRTSLTPRQYAHSSLAAQPTQPWRTWPPRLDDQPAMLNFRRDRSSVPTARGHGPAAKSDVGTTLDLDGRVRCGADFTPSGDGAVLCRPTAHGAASHRITILTRRPRHNMSKIRPLQDRVIVRRVKEEEKSKGGIIIPDTAKEKPTEGEVMAVGNGKVLEDGTVRKLDVKPGDRVLFGKYNGTEVKVDGEDRLIIREEDILGVFEP